MLGFGRHQNRHRDETQCLKVVSNIPHIRFAYLVTTQYRMRRIPCLPPITCFYSFIGSYTNGVLSRSRCLFCSMGDWHTPLPPLLASVFPSPPFLLPRSQPSPLASPFSLPPSPSHFSPSLSSHRSPSDHHSLHPGTSPRSKLKNKYKVLKTNKGY